MRSDEIIGMLRSYVNKSLVGVGAIKGAPCKIQSITDSDGSHTITFSWLDDAGTTHTSQLIVNDGSNIDSITQDGADITITLTDGTSYEFTVPTVQGPKGDKGDKGDAGEGLPEGGTAGQVLVKKSSTDYDMEWDTLNIPSKTSDLTNDSGFITKAVNDLINYYLKSETYSKTEVDDIVTAIKNSRLEVVATLPTTDIKTNVIYLVPKDPAQTSNVKDEYINLDGTTSGWEKIGDTEIDLSGYVTTQALNTALAAYTTTADLTTLLAAKQDTLTFDDAPTENSNNPVKSGGVYAANQNEAKTRSNLGAHNLFLNKAVTQVDTSSGLTFTVNQDKSVTVSVTSEVYPYTLPDAGLFMLNTDSFAELEDDKDYIVTGCPYGGSLSSYFLHFYKTGTIDTIDAGTGSRIFTKTAAMTNVNMRIEVKANYVLNEALTFKPMILLASDTDSTYQPYCETNNQLTQNKVDWDNYSKLGAVNLLPNDNSTQTINGITFTVNDDDTVIADGTATANLELVMTSTLKLDDRTYKISGCPSGGSTSTYKIDVQIVGGSFPAQDTGNGATFTASSSNTYKIRIRILEGTTVSNLTFKPMLTVPSYNGDYVPYAKSNKELTEDVEEVQTNLNPIGKRCFLAFYSAYDGWLGTFATSFGISKNTTLQQLCNIICSSSGIYQEAGEIVITTNQGSVDASKTPLYLQTIANDFNVSGILEIRITIINIGSGRLYVEVKDNNMTYIKRAFYSDFTLASTGVKTQTL